MSTEFNELNLAETVTSAIRDAGYQNPTSVQRNAIPKILGGYDILGIAQTGTGKTASYLLPLISKLSTNRSRALMPRGLILCPTRELAMQISKAFKLYAKNTKLTDLPIIGGSSYKDQEKAIAKSPDVIIATPGRLVDHCSKGNLLLSQTKCLVIDEGDRMLDMGFIPDTKKILNLLPPNRQIMLFSATMPTELESIARQILIDPYKIEITPQGSTSHEIKQKIHIIRDTPKKDSFKDKSTHLCFAIQREHALKNSIIFCNRKIDVDNLARFLTSKGFKNEALHGNLTQTIRNQVLNDFLTGSTKHLIASDVASRGLDIPEVSHVFNFDVPINLEDYVHRIGRTGRAGRAGKAITICFEHEGPLIKKIENLIKRKIDKEDFSRQEKTSDPNRNVSHKKEQRKNKQSEQEKEPVSEQPWVRMNSHIPDFLLKPKRFSKN
mgnify:CR=1 FL=1